MTRRKVTDLYFKPRARHILLVIGILFGVTSLSGVEVSHDLRKIDPAVLFRDVPAAISTPQDSPGAGAARGAPLSVFIRLASEDDLSGQVRNLGGTAWKIHPRIYAASLPPDATRYLSNIPAVRYIEPDRVAHPLLNLSRPAVSADLVHQGASPLPQPFRGDNTFVGIVDTGLSGDHPDFAGRIAHTFSVLGLDPLLDSDGHGTHVAGIAAGDGAASAGTYTGMAPGSSLLIGRAGTNDFQTSDILLTIDNFLQFATSAGSTPVAINLSLGLPVGPHDGTSSFETAVNSLATGTAGSKRIIVVAAGNERNSNEHFRSTVPPFGLATLDVSFAVGTTSAEVEIWADGDDEYSVTATMGTDSFTVPSGKGGTSPSDGISISNKVAAHPNGDTLISVTFLPLQGTGTASIRLTRTHNGGTGNVDGYIDRFFDGTFQAASEAGTVTEPANAENVISIGSFNTKTGGGAGPLGDVSTFSSLGPTRDGRIKPDLAAPGSLIYSARSLEATFAPIEIANDNYVILQGTSMATAHVTGIAALVWESNLNLTGAQMRERLRRTADPQPVGSISPNNTWGYGKVNALRAVSEPVASITAPARTTPGTSVTLTSENSSGPLGAAITAYQWSAPGASVAPSGGASTTFQADAPDDYTVSLVVASGGTDSLPDSRTIRVNNVPAASISGPAAVDNSTTATFTGTGADGDSQQLSFHWILLTRPSGSTSVLTTANVDTVTLVPDVSGTYELGLRVNDGLDESALATHTVAVAVAPSSGGGGGGGGCSVVNGKGEDDAASLVAALLLLLSPLGVLWARKRGYRFPRPCLRGRSLRR